MGLGEDIADLLTTGNLRSTVQVGELLPAPISAVVVVPAAGQPTLRTFGGAVLEMRRVQIRARATDYLTVERLMTSAHGILDGAQNKVLGFRNYQFIEAVQPPFYLGLDQNRNFVMACNYTCYRSAST